ncbi:MAG: Polyphosphate:AMP phosphotransferase [Myxococcota bacterium]|nr:Polyphosphate:AMP phosphotransferase [Myxococcota bacterium]
MGVLQFVFIQPRAEEDQMVNETPHLDNVNLKEEVPGKDAYEAELKDLQKQMLVEQIRLFHGRRRAIIVFEGWDAAGKGGSIRRLTERLDPRGCHVHPIGAPTQEEKRHHYLWRFFHKLPEPGCIAIFDRSWYGRVLVERVEKFAPEKEWTRAYREIREFERWMTDDGAIVAKIFLHISKQEQLKRFKLREADPLKQWKITGEDWRNRKKWSHYEKAVNDMFRETHTENAPWRAISSERKWNGRLKVLQTVVQALKSAK